jgi:aspartyl-tRNA synthetase
MRKEQESLARTLAVDTVGAIGKKVKLQGWVHTLRDHGKIAFIDLRDRSGIVQCVVVGMKEKLTEESVIEIVGMVKERPERNVNKELSTGSVEIEIEELQVLNLAAELPFTLKSDGRDLAEELRLRYRYLDLRRERMSKIVALRSTYVEAFREALFGMDFKEIETPMLTQGTKEGARNFVVPSRLNPGKFYALPQSPQQYKQLLMVAGVERYFQVARCIRDEDLRADRGFEHTQLDLEMSFVTETEVRNTIEKVVTYAVKKVGGMLQQEPFPVFTYEEAIKKFGSDKFDLRTEEEKKKGILAFAWVIRFPFFKRVDKKDEAEKVDSRSGWVFTHNPFSIPIDEHIDWLLKGEHVGEIVTTQYDLVCNGLEVGGGSVRAHRPDLLRATYRIMGYSDAEIEDGVGHMLEAFTYGAPPHGGIALGIDRHVMLLAGEESMKETVAFPMSSTGKTAVTDAPSELSPEQLKIFGLKAIEEDSNVVFEKVKALLNESKVEYDLLEHEPVKTSEEAARVRGTSMSVAPKAMIMKKESGAYVMICIPADCQIDMAKVEKVVGETVKLASPDEVESMFGLKVGAVPPFGSVLGLEMYLDESFWKKDEVAFNAGRRDRSIRMKAKDLIAVAKPNTISKETDFKA